MTLFLLSACSLISPSPDPQPQPGPAPEVNPPEPQQPLVVGEPTTVPKLTTEEAAKWKQTGRLSNVSQPAMPEARISPEQCNDIDHGGPLMEGDSCVTGIIHCEESVIGHTVGGTDRFSTRFYERQFCWPATVDHDSGDERVYKLVMPEGEWRAWATLYTPCADLDLAAVRYDREGCPTERDRVGPCEMTVHPDNHAERIELTTQTRRPGETPTWYIIVEGKDDAEGPFELTVQCRPGLGGPVDP